MSIKIIDNFELGTNLPIDNRLVVNNRNDINLNLRYVGLRIYEKSTGRCLILKDDNDLNNWVEEFSINDHIVGESNYIPKFDSNNKISKSILKVNNDEIKLDNNSKLIIGSGGNSISGNSLYSESIYIKKTSNRRKNIHLNSDSKITEGSLNVIFDEREEILEYSNWLNSHNIIPEKGTITYVIADNDANKNGMYIFMKNIINTSDLNEIDDKIGDIDNWRFIKFDSM